MSLMRTGHCKFHIMSAAVSPPPPFCLNSPSSLVKTNKRDAISVRALSFIQHVKQRDANWTQCTQALPFKYKANGILNSCCRTFCLYSWCTIKKNTDITKSCLINPCSGTEIKCKYIYIYIQQREGEMLSFTKSRKYEYLYFHFIYTVMLRGQSFGYRV